MRNGIIDKAIRAFEDAKGAYLYREEGTKTYLADYNLGVIFECLEEKEKAISYYRNCGKYEKALERLKGLE